MAATTSSAESERLRLKIGLVMPELVAAGRRLVEHPDVARLYPEYLVAMHAIVRASVPLLEAGRDRARALGAADPVAAELARYLAHHVEEELHHDDWALDDLEALGLAREAVLARPPSTTVAAVVGSQYYWIHHYHPVALLGYVGVLEGYAPSPELVDELASRTGHPRAAFRTLAAHAELDPGHSEELDEGLDRLPLSREQSAAVGANALATVLGLARVLDEVTAA